MENMELGAAFLTITTRGIEDAKNGLASIKSSLYDSVKGEDQFLDKLKNAGKEANALNNVLGKGLHVTVIADKVVILPNSIAPVELPVKVPTVPPITVPVNAPIVPPLQMPTVAPMEAPAPGGSFLSGIMEKVSAVKNGVVSAFQATTEMPLFQSIKSGVSGVIEKVGNVKTAIVGALDYATDIPVIKQLKGGISYLNTKFDEFLTKRYGALAKPIKFSGMAVDAAMTLGAGMPIPGMSAVGTLPAMGLAEGHKQVTDYMARKKAREEKGEAPTLLDKGVNAVGRVASKGVNLASGAVSAVVNKVKQIPWGTVASGVGKIGAVASSAFGVAATGASALVKGIGSIGISGEALTRFGEKAKEVFGSFSNTVGQIGSIATRGFAMATGGMGAFVRLADPAGWFVFTQAISAISIQLGRIFIPLLHELTGYLIRVERFLRSLSAETVNQITRWSKLAVIVLGSVMAFSQLFGLLSSGFSILSGFGTVLGALGLATPIGWIVGIALAIAGLLAIVSSTSGGMSGMFAGIRPALLAVYAMFVEAFAAIRPILQAGMDAFRTIFRVGLSTVVPFVVNLATMITTGISRILSVVSPIITRIIGMVSGAYERFAPTLTALLTGVLSVAQSIINVFTRLVGQIAPIIATVIGVIIPLAEQIYQFIYGAIARILPIIARVIDALGSYLIPIITTVFSVVSEVIQVIVEIVSALFSALSPIVNAVIDIFDALMDAIQPLIGMMGEGQGILRTLLMVILQSVLVPFRLIGFLLGLLTPIIAFLCSIIVGLVRIITSVLQPAFEFIAAGLRSMGNAFRMIINGMIDCVNRLIDFYNRLPIPGRISRMSRIDEPEGEAATNERDTGVGSAGGGSTGPDEPRAVGQVPHPSALIAIADAWTKAQTANPMDATNSLLQMQLNQGDTTNDWLESINNNFGGGEGIGSSGGGTFGN